MQHIRRGLGLGLALLTMTALSACANNSSPGNGNNSTSGNKGSVVISGQNFGEMQLMAAMYQDVLDHAGYQATVHLVDTRDIYVPQLKSDKVQVAPDYLAGMADYLQQQKYGPNGPQTASHSPAAVLKVLNPLAKEWGITMLKPAKATDQNAFAVTKKFAQQHSLTTLSSLGASGIPVTLAAASDCQGRDDCQRGLADKYGITIKQILPLGFDTTQVKHSLTSGESQLGEVATTDGALSQEGLVILKDNLGIQPAQNLIPAVNTTFLNAHPDVATILNKLSATLTTSDLAQLDLQVSVNREPAGAVAKAYLQHVGLI